MNITDRQHKDKQPTGGSPRTTIRKGGPAGDDSGVGCIAALLRRAILKPVGQETIYPGYGQSFAERYPELDSSRGHNGFTRGGAALLFIAAFVAGLLTGSAAAMLKYAIAFVSRWVTRGFDVGHCNYWLILLPVAGICLAVAYQRYCVGYPIFHGEFRMRTDFRNRRCYLPVKLMYSPLIASTVTLGFGGSAGSEGPIAYSGAAIGSNVGAFFRLNPSMVRMMMAIGAGAGIAGIFKAPVGGMLFTLEVIGITMSTVSVIALVICCVVSSLTAYVLSGLTPDISFPHPQTVATEYYPIVLLFGVFCGLYSLYYTGMMGYVKSMLAKIHNRWMLAVAGGLVTGLLLFLFPPLYGEGYGLVSNLLDGGYNQLVSGGIAAKEVATPLLLLLLSAGLILAKPLANSATNNSGGVAGDFAPTIMAGSVTGFFFVWLFDRCLGLGLPVSSFVFMGMAGVLSGSCRAPLMAMFLVTEMATMGYGEFMPVAIVATISYITVCLVRFIFRKSRRG